MAEDIDNPLDDELLKELGLEPKAKPAPKPKPARAPEPKATRPPTAFANPMAPKAPAVTDAVPEKGKAPSVTDEDMSASGLKNLSQDMPVQVVAVLGKKTMTLGDVISLKLGEVVEFKKLPQESVDLVANGKLLARGELVLVDGKLGIQIKQLV